MGLFFFLIYFVRYCLSASDLDPFHQSFANSFSSYKLTNGTNSNQFCTLNSSFFVVFGGPTFFNSHTVISKNFSTIQTNGTFYSLEIGLKLTHLDYSDPSYNISDAAFQISLNQGLLERNVSLIGSLPDSCSMNGTAFLMRVINLTLPLDSYNLSVFELSMKIKIQGGNWTTWGLVFLQIDLYECDNDYCSSCSGLPRNCTVFCNIRCKSCYGSAPNHCKSCYQPNQINSLSGICESSTEGFLGFYFNDSYTDIEVNGLKKSGVVDWANIWQPSYMSKCASWNIFGGPQAFGNGTAVSLSVPTNNINHYAIRVLFKFIKIGRWDSENFFFSINDQEYAKQNFVLENDTLVGPICGDTNNSDWNVAQMNQVFFLNHTGSNIQMRFKTDLNDTTSDESWGIRDVYVTYYACAAGCETCTGPTNADCGRCVANTYLNVSGVCLPCDSQCQTCDYNTSYCLSCSALSSKKYLSVNTCVDQCPSHQYPDSSRDCVGCNDECQECSGDPSLCLGCRTGVANQYFGFIGSGGFSICLTFNQCSSYIGRYPDLTSLNCDKCDFSCYSCSGNSTNCTACSPGFFNPSLPGPCQSSCPSGYYNNSVKKTCEKCHAFCALCSDGTNTNCSACNPYYFLSNTTCNQTCPATFVPDSTTWSCLLCQYPCKTCSVTQKNCQSCQTNYFLYKSDCILKCPSGYWASSDGICHACYGDCLTCNGPSSNNCTSCNSTFLNPARNECVSVCPSQSVGINKTCQSCYHTCQECSGITENDCKSCISTFFKQPSNGTCSVSCDPSYYKESSTWECKACHSDCLTCNGPSNVECLSCKNHSQIPFFFENFTCISACPEGYYINYDSSEWKCSSCYQGCKTCLDSAKNSCKSCVTFGYYFYLEMCLTECPTKIGVFANFFTKNCDHCSSGCADCLSEQSDKCISCLSGSYFLNEKCLDKCPSGYFPNVSSLTCEKCSEDCKTCFGPSSSECYSCPDTKFKLNNTCLLNCPDSFFGNSTSQACEKCLSTCLLCASAPDNCSSCVSSHYLNNYKCLSECPDGKYKSINDTSGGTCLACSSKCLTCMSYSECLTCPDLSFLLQNDCLTDCPIYFWNNNQSKKCESCDISCKKCVNSSNNTCESCSAHYYLLNNTCLPQCPSHYFKNEVNQTCNLCSEACDLCSNASAACCINCSSTYYRESGVCVSNCGDGYFTNTKNKTCDKCTPECSQCTGPLISNCQACSSLYYMLNNTCYKECPLGYFKNKMEQICDKCNGSCKSCFGSSSSNCISCSQEKYFYFYQCLEECPEGYYPNTNDQKCYPCHSDCLACTGSDNNGSCTKCNENLVFNEGICQSWGSCPYNKWQNGSICQYCDSSCKTCVDGGPQDCSSCQNGTYLLEETGTCVSECPEALVAVQEFWKCEKICDYTCSDCFGPKQSQCSSCPESRYLVEANSTYSTCQCNSRYFPQNPSLENATCLACDPSCNECSGSSSNECTKCPYNKDLMNGQCLCPVGQYLNSLNCEMCSQNCYTCFGSPDNCRSCKKYQNLNRNNSCECDTGYYTYGLVCYACHYSCLNCNGPDSTNCLANQCNGNHIYSGGLCVCPFWAEDFGKNIICSNKTTLDCYKSCNTSQCFGPDQYSCYSCKTDRFFSNNTCFCKDGTFEDPNDLGGDCKVCDPSCKRCSGPLFSDCLDCISKTRGLNGAAINGVCACSSGTIETLEADCPETPILLKSFSVTFKTTLYVNTPSMAMIALSQTTIVVTKFIETCQLFSFFSYINLQYPLDTKDYFSMLNYFNIDAIFISSSSTGTSNGSTNMTENNQTSSNDTTNSSNFSSPTTEISSNSSNSNARILEESNTFDAIKYGQSKFLENAWILLIINGGVFGFAATYCLIYYKLELSKYSFCEKVKRMLRWNLPIRIFSITSLQLFFYVGLKLSHSFEWNQDGIITVATLIVVSLILLHFFRMINFSREYHYDALWDGVNTFIFIKRNYYTFNVIRKIFVVAFIVSTTLESSIQILGCMVTCLVFLIYILFARPFISNLEWIFSIIMEICYCVLLIVVYTYNHFSIENASEKITFGYAIIISLSVFMLATFIFAVIHIVKFIRKLHMILKTRKDGLMSSRRTASVSSNETPLASKLGKAFNLYAKEVDEKKNVVVVYNKREEEKKRQKEEERIRQKEMKQKLRDIEEEKKNRQGLQNIFAKQKERAAKKKDSFEEEEEEEEQEPQKDSKNMNRDFEDVISGIPQTQAEKQEKKTTKIANIFGRQKKKNKKDSFEEGTESDEGESKTKKKIKEINVEMENFDNF